MVVNTLGFGKQRLVSEIIKQSFNVEDPNSIKLGMKDILYIIQEMQDNAGRKYIEGHKSLGGSFHVFNTFAYNLLYRNLANYDSMLLVTSEKGCLTDDTLIEMPRDLIKYPKGVPIKDLIDKGEIYVYSFNIKEKKIELKKSDGVEFVKEDDVYEIELTNGMKIKATKDHPFLLMNGKYSNLENLRWNKGSYKRYKSDRLRIFSRSYKMNNKDYRIKTNYNDIKKGVLSSYQTKSLEHHFILNQLGYDIKDNIVHHINGNHFDNNIDNLEIIDVLKHNKKHNFDKYYFKENNTTCCATGYSTKKKEKIINGTKEFKEFMKNKRILFCKNNKHFISCVSKEREKNNINSNHIKSGGIIKSIRHIGKRKVYDVVNVRDNHNFIANGFIVSNTGKSSFAIMLARAWCKILGMRFDAKRHLAYSNRDVMNKIDSLGKFEPLVCDEGVRFMASADWNKKESKELRKKIAEVRTKHLLIIMCFPLKISKVEKNFLDSFTNYWCLTGDTKIKIKHNNKEYEEHIDKLVEMKDYEVLTYNIYQYKFEYKKPWKTILTKKKSEVYELELLNGLKIKCTNDHRFLTKEGYLPLHKLNENDKIYTEYKNNCLLCKIKSIKKLKQKENVYDIIGVEDNHNFVANNMVVHNCDLFGRGIGAIFVKDRNPVNDPWRLKDFRNVGSYTEFTKTSDIEKKLRKHPNFWQMIKFPKPPAWLYNKYLEVREHNVYDEDVVREMITTEDVHKSLLLLALQDIMMNDSTLDLNRISLHIKNTYDLPIAKKNIQEIMRDSKQLIYKIREEQIGVK